MSDTIVAIATGAGGGVGIVRLSGPASLALAARLVKPWPDVAESHRLYHGYVHHPATGEPLDEVLACVMRAPRSYTGEDVLELQAHGGAANLARLVAAAVCCGARVAEPGEFTRRAFLQGKLDLTRAEAVAQLIAARSERAVRIAQAQLRGALGQHVRTLADGLVGVLAEIEAAIDFPDEGLEFRGAAALITTIDSLVTAVAALTASYARGRAVMEGVDVVLVGRPNAGKSSLLNALLGEERALVDARPGTTRDFIEVELMLGGVRFRLVDTAGERDTEEHLESRGVLLGRQRRARADLVLLVVDGMVGFGALEADLYAAAPETTLLVWNKSDCAPPPVGMAVRTAPIATVATTGAGLDALRQALLAQVSAADEEEAGVTVTSARQQAALRDAGEALDRARAALAETVPPELVAVDLRLALARLRQVAGEDVGADVLDEVFARFCIGK